MLGEFGLGEIDLLVGTRDLIAKGHGLSQRHIGLA
jgi:hypothetical protein